MACECANLDWSSVDLTQPHHPNCVIAHDASYMAATVRAAMTEAAIRLVRDEPVENHTSDNYTSFTPVPDFSSRLGRFRLSDFLIRQYSEEVRAFMVGMVVVSAQYEFDTRAIIYLAMSDRFDPVPEGERAPEYSVSYNSAHGWTVTRI